MTKHNSIIKKAIFAVFIPLLIILYNSCSDQKDPDPDYPKVVSTYPDNGAANFPRFASITAVFSRDMNEASVTNANNFYISDGISNIPGIITYDSASKTATYNPGAILENQKEYTATLTTGCADTSGNSLKNNYVWSFTTVDTNAVISWNANRESAVNRTGGGYRIYYSNTSGFNINDSGTTVLDVPYKTGSSSPASIPVYLGSGTWYFRILAYSALNGGSQSELSQEQSITVP